MIKVLSVFFILFLIVHQTGAIPLTEPEYNDPDPEENKIPGTSTALRVVIAPKPCPRCAVGQRCVNHRCANVRSG